MVAVMPPPDASAAIDRAAPLPVHTSVLQELRVNGIPVRTQGERRQLQAEAALRTLIEEVEAEAEQLREEGRGFAAYQN